MKCLLLDSETTRVVSTVFSQSEILEHEVYLVERLEAERGDQLLHLKASAMRRAAGQRVLRQKAAGSSWAGCCANQRCGSPCCCCCCALLPRCCSQSKVLGVTASTTCRRSASCGPRARTLRASAASCATRASGSTTCVSWLLERQLPRLAPG